MNLSLISDNGASRLLLVFAGWGMDENPLKEISVPGYDVAVVWDYSTPSLSSEAVNRLEGYKEICVMAWSFGVPVASTFLNGLGRALPVTLTIAVNGTETPVDDSTGIPADIFHGTLESLSEASLVKFYRRMCGGREALARFMETAPERDIASLSNELEAIEALGNVEPARWDIVVVSDRDLVIPTANQLRAWEGHPGLQVVEGPHMPDFEAVVSRNLVDKSLVKCRFGRSRGSYEGAATVQREVAAELAAMLARHGGVEGKEVLEIGCGTGLFTNAMLATGSPSRLMLWDIAPVDIAPGFEGVEIRRCDAEASVGELPEQSLDVIGAASTVQWFNSLPAFLERASAALRPGGVIAFSTYGPETFRALSEITGASLRQPTIEEIKAVVPPALEVVEARGHTCTLTFESVTAMLRHIKESGVNSVDRPSAATAMRVLRNYPVDEAGRATLVYEPLFFVLEKNTNKCDAPRASIETI